MNLNQNIFLAAIMALSLTATGRAGAQDAGTNAPAPRFNENAFQIIERRNIFNPNRRAYRPPTPTIRIETATLNGTMTYEDQSYAFFGNRTVKPTDKIGDYKVTAITNNAVKLADASNQIVNLVIGMQLRREGDGPWKVVSGGSDTSSSPSSSGSSDQTNGSSASTTTYKGADEDVVKKLMAKRLAEEKGNTDKAPEK